MLSAHQKLLDHPKQSVTGALKSAKTASKRVIEKTVEATGDLICNKNVNKVMQVSKTYNKIIQRQLQTRMIKKYLKKKNYLQKRDKKLLMIQD